MDALLGAARDVASAWLELWGLRPPAPRLARSPRDELPLPGGARLLRFTAPAAPTARAPILLVPSLINRWYVLDLMPGASLVEALVRAGLDVWLLDWGVPGPEDRDLDWDAVLRRLGRAAQRVLREAGRSRLALLGYSMGGTIAAIHAAQHPDTLAALVTLAAPIDFSRAGALRRMVDPAWFDAGAVAAAGNAAPWLLQAGFAALQPTLGAARLAAWPALALDPEALAEALALDAWASDPVALPGEAYRRFIGDLCQGNQLVAGTHRVNGAPVPLGAIRCPVLAVTPARDAICPPPAAAALVEHVGSTDAAVLAAPGGHVDAVVGRRAARELYPALVRWLAPRLRA